ncbi:MAG: acyltransferase [Rhodanobacter sp.]
MNRLPGLDLLRAIAIVWVMLFHSWVIDGWGHFGGVETFGWMGVDLFFVLSGYLIGSQLLKPLANGEPVSFADFYLRRAFRVLPVFFVVLALYFLWPAFREFPGIQPLWQFLSFTINLLIDYEHNKAFSHVWSLCVEEHFYLLFPWLAWWLTRRPSVTKFISVCIAVVLGGMAIRGYVWLHEIAPLRGVDDGRLSLRYLQDIYYPTWSRLDGLLIGVVLATIKAYRPELWTRLQHKANSLMFVGLIVVGLAIWLFRGKSDLLSTVVGYPLLSLGLGLLVLAGAGTQSWLGKWRVPGAGWIALTSYSLYLSHKAVLHLVEVTLGTQVDGHGVLTFAVYTLAVLAVGALLYYTVERPFLRLRERFHVSAKPQSDPSGAGASPLREVTSSSM